MANHVEASDLVAVSIGIGPIFYEELERLLERLQQIFE